MIREIEKEEAKMKQNVEESTKEGRENDKTKDERRQK